MDSWKLIGLVFLICFIQSLNAQSDKTFLPKPTGIYDVGTTKLYLIDSSRKDPFKRSDFRKIYVKIWYPASLKSDDQAEKYLDDYPLEIIYQAFKSKKLDKKWISQLQQNETFSFPEVDIAWQKEKYPVLFFNPGFYFGLPELYSSLMEELASQGYFVCSINHPYEQPYIDFQGDELYIKRKRAQWAYLQLVVADLFQWKARDSEEHIAEITRYYHKMLHRFQKTVNLWTEDSRFVIDFFEESENGIYSSIINRMDLERIGAFGQSLGGAVSGQLCTQDKRVKAGANLDCFQFGDPINQPIQQAFMLIESEYSKSWNLGNTINYKETVGDFAFLSFPGSSHFVFSDAAVLPYESEDIKKSMVGNVDGAKVLGDLKLYLVDFFNFYLQEDTPEYIHSDRKLSHLIYNFRKGRQFKKASSRALND